MFIHIYDYFSGKESFLESVQNYTSYESTMNYQKSPFLGVASGSLVLVPHIFEFNLRNLIPRRRKKLLKIGFRNISYIFNYCTLVFYSHFSLFSGFGSGYKHQTRQKNNYYLGTIVLTERTDA